MATQIFRVDLSEKARDFQATATEPGLAMLDRQGGNFEILQNWFGTLIAEPEWRGPDLVNFYVNEEQGGRLEDIYVFPCTKKDLDGALDDQVEELESRLKRARPETANEELLLKIVRDQFKTLTADLDHSDFDCHFFKYRLPGSPWKLVWCWGFQRTDLQPCPSLICHNPDCNILFVRRPDTKNRCPRCQALVDRKRRRGVWGTIRRYAIPIALALLFLLLLLGWFGRPQLVVKPGDWAGPPGSRAAFKVYDSKWYIFSADVTGKVLPQSNDTRVISFDKYGCTAIAGVLGDATLTFRYEDRITSVRAKVVPAEPPDSLAIELNPAKNVLGVGSTAKVTVWGKYADGRPDVDFSQVASWEISDDQIIVRRGQRVEGVDVGKATLTALMDGKNNKRVSDTADFEVKEVDYLTIEVNVDPDVIPLGGGGQMSIDALDAAGERWCLLGSSLLPPSPIVAPYELAQVEGDETLAGRQVGSGTLTATIPKKEADPISGSCQFSVSDQGLLAGGLSGPEKVVVRVYESLDVDLTATSMLPFDGTSANPEIAEALSGFESKIVGRSVGTTNVTFSQGDDKITITVEVVNATITGIDIVPEDLRLVVNEPGTIRVLAKSDKGEFDLAPDVVEWMVLPPPQYVDFNRDLLEFTGRSPTPEPESLIVRMLDRDDLPPAAAEITVAGNPLTDALADGSFGAYPPINGGIGGDIGLGDYGAGTIVGGALNVPGGLAGIPAGSRIVGVGDTMFDGMSPGQIRDYLAANPLAGGDVLSYLGPNGVLGTGTLPPSMAEIQAQAIATMGAIVTNSQTSNVSSSGFSAAVSVRVARSGQYRVVDGSGASALSNYVDIAEGGEATITMPNVPRAPGETKIELNIERNLGGQTRLIPFTLDVGGG